MASHDNVRLLPFGIIHSILAKPIFKVVVGFMNVCKEHVNFLKTSSLIPQHSKNVSDIKTPFILIHKYNKPDSRSFVGLIYPFFYNIEDMGLPFLDEKSVWKIIDSCNGVICLQLQLTGDFYLWNPVNRQVLEVPSILTLSERRSSVVGFVYSSLLNDYKIVVIRAAKSDCAHMYSFNTGVWREIEVPDSLSSLCEHDYLYGTASNDGYIFWISAHMLIWFDIVREVFREREINVETNYYAESISVYNNLLAIQLRSYMENEHPCTQVWLIERVVNEDGRNLSLTVECMIPQGLNDHSYAMCICRNEILFRHIEDGMCRFRLYNFINHEETWLDCPDNHHTWETFNFEKSFVSIQEHPAD